MLHSDPIIQNLRSATFGVYDLQKLRIQQGNRLCAQFRTKLGLGPSDKDEDGEEDVQEVLKLLRASYKRITDGFVAEGGSGAIPTLARFAGVRHKGEGVISEYVELILVDQYIKMEESEQRQFNNLKYILREIPVWNNYLKDVKGIGPAVGAIILSYIDIHKAKYASSLWKFAGLDVVIEDGRGRGRYKEHQVEREYVNKHGEVTTRMSITFSPMLKTKLLQVLGSSFLKCKSPWSDVYYDVKNRYTNLPRQANPETAWTKRHIHNAAMRYMIKMFLIDLYKNWRAIENLPVFPPYHEAKLGLFHNRPAA